MLKILKSTYTANRSLPAGASGLVLLPLTFWKLVCLPTLVESRLFALLRCSMRGQLASRLSAFANYSLSKGCADTRGAAAVEFGLVAAPALFTLCAIFAIGLNFFMVAALDHATLVGARAVTTGAVSTAGMSASSFQQQVICPALPSMFNCNNVFVNMQVVTTGQSPSGYYAFVNAAQSALIQPPLNSATDTFCPGAGSQYIVLQVLYPAPYFLSYLTAKTATSYNGQRVNVLMSSATFKTEPYSGAATYQGC